MALQKNEAHRLEVLAYATLKNRESIYEFHEQFKNLSEEFRNSLKADFEKEGFVIKES